MARRPAVPGAVKLALLRRLGADWRTLADLLDVPLDRQRQFDNADDPGRSVWEWLEDRDGLDRLPEALRLIGRADLAELLTGDNAGLRHATMDFSALIQDRTDEFVGRRGLVRRLGELLDDPEFGSGYVVIHGEPGIGKTALLARLVAEHGYVHHFNSVLIGLTSAERFLTNVCAQLILAYDLPYDRLPEADSPTLLRLLGESARGRRVVVAVDAVDEASGGPAGGNRLLLPPALPAGAFMLVTMRNPENVPLYVDARRDLVLDENDPENVCDAREYVEMFLVRHGAGMSLGMSAVEFTELVIERSEGNFMYLRHVLHGVRDNAIRGALDELPRGLRAYYGHLEAQLGLVDGAGPERQLRVLAVLANWPEPLTVARLAHLAGESPAATRAVLRGWAGFLNRIDAPDETRYALYHASFRDYLADRIDPAEVRSRMAMAIEDLLP